MSGPDPGATRRNEAPSATGAPTVTFQTADDRLSRAHAAVRLQPGQIFGRYRLFGLLGQGGMGEVYEAEELDSGRRVAVKTLRNTLQGEHDRARFFREGQLAASVSHPNTVYVFGTEEVEGVPVIAMELVPGGTLQDRLKATGRFEPERAVDVILQVIAGLEAAALVGVLHRDVKPSNCFIDGEGRVKVGDFGLSISTARDDTRVTQANALLGTPNFAAPEQLRGEPLDVRADIYAVGATLYALLVGRPPFNEAGGVVQIIARVLQEAPAPSRTTRRDVPARLDRIVLQCLAKSPADRPQSYAQLATLLQPFGTSAATPATAGLRAFAGVMDWVIVSLVQTPLMFLTRPWEGVPATVAQAVVSGLPIVAVFVAYFVTFERLCAGSPGKLAMRLRVVRVDGRPVDTWPLVGRALLWILALLVPGWFAAVVFPRAVYSPAATTALGFAPLAGLGVLFLFARRRNGFAGLHDLATRTRVVSNLRPHIAVAAPEPDDVPSAVPTQTLVGPYRLLDGANAPAGTIAGFDERIRRRVWIRRLPNGTPPVAPARRDLNRPARLRWLSGQREAGATWDAYEAVSGWPLDGVPARFRTWTNVRRWLLELAEEVAASANDGATVPLDVTHVWIGNGRARLLDWPAGQASAGESEATGTDLVATQRLLHDVARRALDAPRGDLRAGPSHLPLHARDLLADLAATRFSNLTDLIARLRSVNRRFGTLSRWHRGAHLLACGAPALLFAFFTAVVIWLVPLFMSPDLLLVDRCFTRLQQLERAPRTPQTEREINAVEIYLAGHYGPLLKVVPGQPRSLISMTLEAKRGDVERIVSRHPALSADEIRRADLELAPLVADVHQQLRNMTPSGMWFVWVLMQSMILVVTGVVGIACALAVPGGAMMRLLSIAVVGQDGEPIVRRRSVLRASIAWAPACAPLAWLFAASPGNHSTAVLIAALTASSLFVAGAVIAFINPERGVQDRLCGTYLVPR